MIGLSVCFGDAGWNEIDFDQGIWVIPATRMKIPREHRVPLSERAVDILRSLYDQAGEPTGDDFIFLGGRKGRPLSNMALLMTLKRMKRVDLTTHGFRSSFRDWTSERTDFPREVAEAALAHVIGDRVEAAYRRGDLFDKRRQLMDAWGQHCEPQALSVPAHHEPQCALTVSFG